MKASEINLLIGILFPIIFGIAGCSLAKTRKRNMVLWFINCWLTGLIGVVLLSASPKLRTKKIKSNIPYQEDYEEKAFDTLGFWVLIIGLLVFAFQIWYGFQSAKSYYNQMFWNFYFSR